MSTSWPISSDVAQPPRISIFPHSSKEIWCRNKARPVDSHSSSRVASHHSNSAFSNDFFAPRKSSSRRALCSLVREGIAELVGDQGFTLPTVKPWKHCEH